MYKGNRRYVPELNQQGLPTGKYIDQKDPFGDLLNEDDFYNMYKGILKVWNCKNNKTQS